MFDQYYLPMTSTTLSIRASDGNHHPRQGAHRHDHYEILIIESGSGTHMIDFELFNVCSNQIYFLRPGQVHEFRPNKGAQFYFIAFDKDDVLMHAPTQLNQFEFFQSFHLTGPVVMDEVDSIIEDMVRIQTELNQPAQLQDI